MRIIGIGTEIVECLRIRRLIDRHGELFLNRVFTERETRDCQARRNSTEHFAGRWAAKEAVRKCLRPGAVGGFAWTEIEIRTDLKGLPSVLLHGPTKDLALALKVTEFLVSMAHCRNYATAHAIAVHRTKDE
ncbi:MAG: holo-ACP synthase [Gemmataceae bacterium]